MPIRHGGKRSKKRQNLAAAQGLGDDHLAGAIDRMDLKNMLGEIEANAGDIRNIGG